ncbi:MAG TPA: hypothetical protein VFJ81_04605 [Gemmatimonadales bacterium]|nr:hypothetical protein [Gemmatimonadales bacterium]
MNGRMPILLTAIAAVLAALAVLVLQPYSVRSPWTAYSAPARRYLRAALERDSLELVHQSAGAGSVTWALAVGRRHSDSLAVWSRSAEAWAGIRHADTAEVFVAAPQSSCSLVFRFVGPARRARVQQASGACFPP